MGQSVLESEPLGFVGAISGLSLADIIQVKGDNFYSGCLVVEQSGKSGIIYFREGEIVHAEQENLDGEEAFYKIMGWVGGTFRSEPKISTTRRTIDQGVKSLILEAFCRIDEAKRSQQEAPAETSSPTRKDTGVSDISNKLSVIPEIEKALVMTKDGAVVDDTTCEAELLAGNGLFLSLFVEQVGSHFGVGDFKAATVHGVKHHLFLFDSKRHHLCISAKGSASVISLDSEIRRVLAQK